MLQPMEDIKPPHPILTMLESRALAETGRLLLSLPVLRLTARRGSGESVLVLPGFMADDRSTYLLRQFLDGIGYKSIPWNLGINRRPMLEYLGELAQLVRDVNDKTGVPLRIVGWSRGGIIARELARDMPDEVDRVITIGTPIKGGTGASSIGRWVQREVGITPVQLSQLLRDRQKVPISVPVRAIYSKSDGIVSWRACIDDASKDVKHYEVTCSHTGMGSSTEVFALVPRLLAS